jgi:hypothetical protein
VQGGDAYISSFPASCPGQAAFALGTLKARYTSKGSLRCSLEVLAIVTVGTVAGVVIGALLHAVWVGSRMASNVT